MGCVSVVDWSLWDIKYYELSVELCEAWLACIVEDEHSVDHGALPLYIACALESLS